MKKIALFAIIALTAGCIDATAQNKKDMKKVLFVLTSHSELGDTGEKTGFWTEEFAAPYYELADKGVIIDIATQKEVNHQLIQSEDPSAATEDTKRFDKDTELKAKLKETHKLADVKESDYDAVFYPGGHCGI
jgi:putative intracellular protease/amidase